METAIIVLSAITLMFVGSSLLVALRRGAKPRMKIYFPDGYAHTTYKRGEEVPVSFHIKNIGAGPLLPKLAAAEIVVFVYTPLNFELKKIIWGRGSDSEVINAPADGIFKGMHYVRLGGGGILGGGFSLYYQEVEAMTVDMKMPEETGRYIIQVPIDSKQGDLGIHKLQISVI